MCDAVFSNPFSSHFLVEESDYYILGLGKEFLIVVFDDLVARCAENWAIEVNIFGLLGYYWL